MPAKLTGAEQLDRALGRAEEDATDRNVLLAGAALVVARARGRTRSTRVAGTGRTLARKGLGIARFGSAATPWTPPSHFGHGAPGNTRPQGGYMIANPFLFEAAAIEEDRVFDLFLTRTTKALRDNGLS